MPISSPKASSGPHNSLSDLPITAVVQGSSHHAELPLEFSVSIGQLGAASFARICKSGFVFRLGSVTCWIDMARGKSRILRRGFVIVMCTSGSALRLEGLGFVDQDRDSARLVVQTRRH